MPPGFEWAWKELSSLNRGGEREREVRRPFNNLRVASRD